MLGGKDDGRRTGYGGARNDGIGGAVVVDAQLHVSGSSARLMETDKHLNGAWSHGGRADARRWTVNMFGVIRGIQWQDHCHEVVRRWRAVV